MSDHRSVLRLTPRPAHPDDVHCPQCRKLIFDVAERVLLARVTKFREDGTAWATCKMCKCEVQVPVRTLETTT